jgi:hypothetical protein
VGPGGNGIAITVSSLHATKQARHISVAINPGYRPLPPTNRLSVLFNTGINWEALN